MRISTLARLKSAIFLFAMLALASQYAFAQLPIETRQMKLQGSTSGAIILQVPPTVTGYTLTYPQAVGTGSGSFLFLGSSDGQFKWSSSVATTGHIPVWDGAADLGTGSIRWVGADSPLFPVWSLSGNELDAADKKLGSTSNQPFDIITNNQARVTFAANGDISINTQNTGANTTIGRVAAGHLLTVNGETVINGGANTGSTTIGNSTSTFTSNAGTLDINATTATLDATSLTIVAPTSINVTGTSGTTIGNAASTLTSNAGVLDVNATTVTMDVSGSIGLTGTTDVNVTGSSVTTIGNASSSLVSNAGAVTVNSTTAAINAGTSLTVVAPTSINVTGTSGTTIGNAASTLTSNAGTLDINAATATIDATTSLTVTGVTNINTGTSASLTSIGNSGAGDVATASNTKFSGHIQMETNPGVAGDVLISSGANNTPSWKNLNDAIGIRAAGNVTVTNGVATATISAPGMLDTDAILITMQTTASTTSAVTATVTNRNDATDTFTVTFSAQYSGVVNYLVIKTL